MVALIIGLLFFFGGGAYYNITIIRNRIGNDLGRYDMGLQKCFAGCLGFKARGFRRFACFGFLKALFN